MGGEDGARWGEENYPGGSHGPSSEGRGLMSLQACPGPHLGELEGEHRSTARTWGLDPKQRSHFPVWRAVLGGRYLEEIHTLFVRMRTFFEWKDVRWYILIK